MIKEMIKDKLLWLTIAFGLVLAIAFVSSPEYKSYGRSDDSHFAMEEFGCIKEIEYLTGN